MDKLVECRNKIDNIDSQIILLFEERMNVVKEVSIYKLENNKEILDASREKIMLENNLAKMNIEEFKKYYHFILEGFLTASKEMQKDLIASYNNK